MSTVRGCRVRPISRKVSFIADQRGAVAFEMPVVTILLIFGLLLPLADMAIAGFQYISAYEALRAFGQSILYSPPPDPTNATSWASTATAKADPHFPIPSIQIICGDNNTGCSDATLTPKYFSYTTNITLAPMVLKPVLCTSVNANPCTYTLPYSERFQ
jgi:hypothetical protein